MTEDKKSKQETAGLVAGLALVAGIGGAYVANMPEKPAAAPAPKIQKMEPRIPEPRKPRDPNAPPQIADLPVPEDFGKPRGR